MAKAKVVGKTGGSEERAFSDGVLVYLEIRQWGATAQLDNSKLAELGLSDRELLDQIRAVRSILTPEGQDLLNQYRTVKNEAKGWLYRNSIPFPVNGFVFLPKSMIERADAYLKQRAEEAQMIVDTIVPAIKKMESDYAAKFPQLYDAACYPTEAQLRRMFTFRWSFRVFAPPAEELRVLPPEIYREEVQRFKQDINSMREMTLNAVGNALLGRIKNLSEQCENDTVKTQTVNSIKSFLEKFDELFSGFVQQDKLNKLISDVKEYMDGTDASMLSADDEFRSVVGAKMKEVVSEIKTVPGLQLKRGFEL